MEAGDSRRKARATTAAATAATASIRSGARQPWSSARRAMTGRKSSWPVAVLAVSAPITRPRRVVNQRLTTTDPSTRAAMPAPVPTSRPHSTTSCQGARMKVARNSAVASMAMARPSVRRTPMRSAMAAQKGPIRP
jgi:hypothetical protein